jgi:hypothetical protein
LTVSAWINWQGVAAGSPQATILSKGPVGSPTYSLSILADGRLQFSIFRNVHRNWFIYSDNINQPITIITDDKIYQNKWTHVTATLGSETMRIYIDGKQVIETKINKYGILSATTNNLIRFDDPLLIAVEKIDNPAWPFRGLMDDIQFYTRMLVPDEVEQVYNLGVCPPGSAE